MEEATLQTLVQIKAFLDGTSGVAFRVPKEERNHFIERVLKRFGYAPQGRADKGILLRYIGRMTGLSRQQVTRLVRQYRKHGKLSKQPCAPKRGFTHCYTAADVALLAETDVLHSALSGPATKKLMERACQVFGPALRALGWHLGFAPVQPAREQAVPEQTAALDKNQPNRHPYRPAPRTAAKRDARYIRIDSVHQGDQDGVKGVYHINAVDCVTQMQFVATCDNQ